MRLRILLVMMAFLVGACQYSATVREELGRGFVDLQGARVVLKKDIGVAAGRARVYIQDGGPDARQARVRSSGFDSFRPSCAFEIDSVDHPGVTISADSFLITRVQATVVEVVSLTPVQVAGLRLTGAGGIDGGPMLYSGYHFWLASEKQPDVRRMTCYGVYAESGELYPPTLAEIRRALRGVAEIEF
ncbi:MAG: hypothetical protein WBN68_17715 [Sedimenticolaceae bacterium]